MKSKGVGRKRAFFRQPGVVTWRRPEGRNTYTIIEVLFSYAFNRNNTKYDFESFYPGANTLKNESELKLLGSDLHVLERNWKSSYCKGAVGDSSYRKGGKKI